ncbi:MAG: hypothetical protein HY313_11055 [Acidobacteria bacterium]|nr:hypothetical protein [Acidobacteriota bacterium]
MFIQNWLPQTGVGRIGWLFEWSCLVAGLYIFLSFLYRDWRERAGGVPLPAAEALRNRGPETLAANTTRPILYTVLRTLHSRGGYIQEEEITAALEEHILSRGESLRDTAALAILTALFFTFLTLYSELRGPAAAAEMDSRLRGVFDLVGVNWPGILAALICTLCAAYVRHRNTSLLHYYRNWLDVDIFPKMSAARTTVDQLGKLTQGLNEAVVNLTGGLQPLGQLPAVLARFQNEIIGNLLPTLVDGMQRVPVSLSDTTIQQLRKLSGDSNRLIAQVTRDYGKLVLLSEQSERRQTEIAAGITKAASALQELKSPVDGIVEAIAEYGRAMLSTSAELGNFAQDLKAVGDQLPALTKAVEQAGAHANALTRPLDDVTGALNIFRGDLANVAVNIAGFNAGLKEIAVQTKSLGDTVSRIISELTSFSAALGETVSRIFTELSSFSVRLENSTETIGKRLASAETLVTSSMADLKAISNSGMEESGHLRDALKAADQAISVAQQSLIASAKELFDKAAEAREDEKKALIEAGAALRESTTSLENKISEAARTLTDTLSQTGDLWKKCRELESKVNVIAGEVVNLDRDTRGRGLVRRVFHGGDSQ